MHQIKNTQPGIGKKAAIDAVLAYIAAPLDRQALEGMVRFSPHGTYGPSIEGPALEAQATVSFFMRDKVGIERKVRFTPALYAFALIADALGHMLHINRRASDSYDYLRLVHARAPGQVDVFDLSGDAASVLPDEKMPYNFDMQRILFGAGQGEKVFPKSEDRLDLTYGNWFAKGGHAKTDEASLVLALLAHPKGWISPITGSPSEQEAACKTVLMAALHALETEREVALRGRAA